MRSWSGPITRCTPYIEADSSRWRTPTPTPTPSESSGDIYHKLRKFWNLHNPHKDSPINSAICCATKCLLPDIAAIISEYGADSFAIVYSTVHYREVSCYARLILEWSGTALELYRCEWFHPQTHNLEFSSDTDLIRHIDYSLALTRQGPTNLGVAGTNRRELEKRGIRNLMAATFRWIYKMKLPQDIWMVTSAYCNCCKSSLLSANAQRLWPTSGLASSSHSTLVYASQRPRCHTILSIENVAALTHQTTMSWNDIQYYVLPRAERPLTAMSRFSEACEHSKFNITAFRDTLPKDANVILIQMTLKSPSDLVYPL
jgi:hypothetical protein